VRCRLYHCAAQIFRAAGCPEKHNRIYNEFRRGKRKKRRHNRENIFVRSEIAERNQIEENNKKKERRGNHKLLLSPVSDVAGRSFGDFHNKLL
jgi:hypothetical protein